MRTYEVLFILSPQVTEEETTTLINDFKGIAANIGANLKSEDAWGRRRLAYEINKKAEGIYAVVDLQATPEAVAELDRQLRLNESILRTKVIRPETR